MAEINWISTGSITEIIIKNGNIILGRGTSGSVIITDAGDYTIDYEIVSTDRGTYQIMLDGSTIVDEDNHTTTTETLDIPCVKFSIPDSSTVCREGYLQVNEPTFKRQYRRKVTDRCRTNPPCSFFFDQIGTFAFADVEPSLPPSFRTGTLGNGQSFTFEWIAPKVPIDHFFCEPQIGCIDSEVVTVESFEPTKTGDFSFTISTPDLNENEVNETPLPPTPNSVQIQIVNASYKEALNGQRNFKFDVNYSIQNLSDVPLNTKIDLKVQFLDSGGFVTRLLTILKTLFDQDGTLSVSIFDSQSLNTLPDSTMTAQVFMWLRGTQTPISPNVQTTLNLAVEQPPTEPEPTVSMVSITPINFRIENNRLLGDIDYRALSAFDSFWFNKRLASIIQLTDTSTNQIIHLKKNDIIFNVGELLEQINVNESAFGRTSLEVEIFVWVDENDSRAFSPPSVLIANEVAPQDPIPISNMISQVILDPVLQDGTLTGRVNLTTTNTFDSFFFNKTQKHVLQIKSLDGAAIDTVETDVIFTAQNQLREIPIDVSGMGNNSIIIESFVWDSQNLTFSQIASVQVDVTPTLPSELPNESFAILFFDGSKQSFILEDSQFILLQNQPTDTDWSIVDIADTQTTINATFTQVIDVINTKLATRINDTVGNTMVTQVPVNFEIRNDRVIGTIDFTANSNFNSFWFGKILTSFVQIKNPTTGIIFVLKQNDLNFTDSERTESIIIDEFADGLESVDIEFFVWISLTDPRAFSDIVSLVASETVLVVEGDEFSQEFTAVTYETTPTGVLLTVQVQVSKDREVDFDRIKSVLRVVTSSGAPIDTFQQEISVMGVSAFAIVYEIDNLSQTPESITLSHFMTTLDGSFVSDDIRLVRTLDQELPPEIPTTPTKKDPFKTAIGLFAGLFAVSLLASKSSR